MACFSQEQLARLALGLTEDADLTAHLKECASCRARGETMQSLVHQLTAAHAKFDSGHEESRERLMAILPASRPLEPMRSRNRITHWIGELTMRQRMALGGIGAVAVLAILLLWLGSAATPLSAMEQMAENIRKAKSIKYSLIVQIKKNHPEPGKPPVSEYKCTIYWIAPGSSRVESMDPGWKGPGPNETEIIPFDKPSITINHQKKKYYHRTKEPQGASVFADMELENLGRFSGKADRELGTKEIGGKKVRGFQIDMKKMEPESDSGLAEIWLDIDCNLPVLVRYEGIKHQFSTSTDIITDIQWNIDLDPKLFDTTPPEGYTDATPKTPTLEACGPQITEALRIYAEASGGRYSEKGYHMVDDICKIYGIDKYPAGEKEGNAGKAAKAIEGDHLFNKVEFHSSDFAYNGKTVRPSDKDKILLRWKLDNGNYAIIYGDLHYECVTAEKLHSLEGK
jgi:outer membrane lipoprotein-sorting protein